MSETVEQFAARIKSKYPDYSNVPDEELVQRVVSKHPEYKDQIDFGQQNQSQAGGTGILDYPGPMGLNKLLQSGAKTAGKFLLKEGPKMAGAALGGTLGAPLGPAGVIGGAGLGATAVGAMERMAGLAPTAPSVGGQVAEAGLDFLTGALQEAGPALKTAVPGGIVTKQIENDLMRGIKPINRKTDFRQTLQRAVPDVAETAGAMKRPIESLGDLEPVIAEAKKQIWSKEYAPLLKPNQSAEIDGNSVADAMVSTITKRFELQNPEKAAKIKQIADTYRRPLTLAETEDFLQSTNNDLSSFYAKNKVGQRMAERDPEWAFVVKEGQELRKQLYSKLDELGGPGAAEIKKRYGALTNLEEEVLRRKNVAERQNPQSLAEQISIAQGVGRGAKAIATGNIGDAAMAIGQPLAAKFIRGRNTSDALVKRAFSAYNSGLSQEPTSDILLRSLPVLTRSGAETLAGQQP